MGWKCRSHLIIHGKLGIEDSRKRVSNRHLGLVGSWEKLWVVSWLSKNQSDGLKIDFLKSFRHKVFWCWSSVTSIMERGVLFFIIMVSLHGQPPALGYLTSAPPGELPRTPRAKVTSHGRPKGSVQGKFSPWLIPWINYSAYNWLGAAMQVTLDPGVRGDYACSEDSFPGLNLRFEDTFTRRADRASACPQRSWGG